MELKCDNEELKHQLGVPRKGQTVLASPTKSRGASVIPPLQRRVGKKGSTASANMDIELPATVLGGTGGIIDKSFLVGSPPSSSGESLGSDQSEMIRRALELGGVIPIAPEGLILSDENQSPEIGSAVSAREAFGASGGGGAAGSNGGLK